MNNTSLSKWLEYINEWTKIDIVKYTNTPKPELKHSKFVIYKFFYFDIKNKNDIRNILLKKDNIELLTTQYNQENNLYILDQLNPIVSSQLKSNNGIYFFDNEIIQVKISYKYIILYYIFFCDNEIIEKIHWSYFRIDLINPLINKKISVKKIIEILNWNYIYNNSLMKELNIINKIYFTNSVENKILLDYINGLEGNKISHVSFIPPKYSTIIKNLGKNIKVDELNTNYSNPIIIKELILKNDDKIFDKLFDKLSGEKKLKKFINSISCSLLESNIKEKNILKLINLCLEGKKMNLLTSNYILFIKLLNSGYVYSIEKIWSKSIPSINWKIFVELKKIILKTDTSLFEHLLKSKIINEYLYLNSPYKMDIWFCILIFTNKISPILNKYNYKIPCNVLKNFCSIFNNVDKKIKSWRKSRLMRKYKLNVNFPNVIFNIKTFNIPMNENLINVLFNYLTDEQIITYVNSIIKIVNLEQIINLTLNYKRFVLLKKIFVHISDKNIMNKTIFENNINKYTKNINDKNKLGSIYSYCINNLGFKLKKKYEIFGLKYRTNNLLKTILGKQKNILNPKNVIKYLFNVGINKWGDELPYSGDKEKENFIETYNFIKSNMINWKEIYKSIHVCKIILELFSYTLDDYLAMVEFNNTFTFDLNYFIFNKYVDNDLKKNVLLIKAEINYNLEYITKKKLGIDDGTKYKKLSKKDELTIIKKFDEIIDENNKINDIYNIY